MESEHNAADAVTQWTLITRAVAAAQRRTLDRVEASGLPGQWFAALHLLLNSPDHRLSMSHSARDLSMTTGGFTKLADRLGRDGLIDRRGASADRRMIFAVLTPKGLEVAQQAALAYEAAVREHIVDVIGVAQLRTIADVLHLLDPADHGDPDSVEPDSLESDGTSDEIQERDPDLPDRRRDDREPPAPEPPEPEDVD